MRNLNTPMLTNTLIIRKIKRIRYIKQMLTLTVIIFNFMCHRKISKVSVKELINAMYLSRWHALFSRMGSLIFKPVRMFINWGQVKRKRCIRKREIFSTFPSGTQRKELISWSIYRVMEKCVTVCQCLKVLTHTTDMLEKLDLIRCSKWMQQRGSTR